MFNKNSYKVLQKDRSAYPAFYAVFYRITYIHRLTENSSGRVTGNMKRTNSLNLKYLTEEPLIKTRHLAMLFSMQEMLSISRRNMKMQESSLLKVTK